jgi:hypothetical protein
MQIETLPHTRTHAHTSNENWGCEDVTADNMRRYRDLLAKCIGYAVDKGFDVAVLAHLDNMKEYTWRNILQVCMLWPCGCVVWGKGGRQLLNLLSLLRSAPRLRALAKTSRSIQTLNNTTKNHHPRRTTV